MVLFASNGQRSRAAAAYLEPIGATGSQVTEVFRIDKVGGVANLHRKGSVSAPTARPAPLCSPLAPGRQLLTSTRAYSAQWERVCSEPGHQHTYD